MALQLQLSEIDRYFGENMKRFDPHRRYPVDEQEVGHGPSNLRQSPSAQKKLTFTNTALQEIRIVI